MLTRTLAVNLVSFGILKIAEAAWHLRFCLAHSCRYHRPSLDRVAELPNTWFDCSAHRIHCRGVVDGLSLVAGAKERFKADYRDAGEVLHRLASEYLHKLVWRSNTPFESYVGVLDGERIALRSTYAEEAACVKALPKSLRSKVAFANPLAFVGKKGSRRLRTASV